MSKKNEMFVPEDYNTERPIVEAETKEESKAEEDKALNAEIQAEKVVPTEYEAGTLPETFVHDSHGNVRAEVSDLGVGTVTTDDVIQSGRFEFRKRDDGLYDIYNRDGMLVVVGASAKDLENYK